MVFNLTPTQVYEQIQIPNIIFVDKKFVYTNFHIFHSDSTQSNSISRFALFQFPNDDRKIDFKSKFNAQPKSVKQMNKSKKEFISNENRVAA